LDWHREFVALFRRRVPNRLDYRFDSAGCLFNARIVTHMLA